VKRLCKRDAARIMELGFSPYCLIFPTFLYYLSRIRQRFAILGPHDPRLIAKNIGTFFEIAKFLIGIFLQNFITWTPTSDGM
jgi:hypothetical protein